MSLPRKKSGAPCGPDHTDLPRRCELWTPSSGCNRGAATPDDSTDMQHVSAFSELRMAAERAECKDGARAENLGNVDAAHGKIAALPRPLMLLIASACLHAPRPVLVIELAPSSDAFIRAPVSATIVSVLKRRVGPLTVNSSAVVVSGLPKRLASRNDRSSIGPLGGTPTCQRWPPRSCTPLAPGATHRWWRR